MNPSVTGRPKQKIEITKWIYLAKIVSVRGKLTSVAIGEVFDRVCERGQ
jgi:hypothetical protein